MWTPEDQAERLAQLLHRRRELRTVNDDDNPFGAIIRRDELFVESSDVTQVEEAMGRWAGDRHDLEDLGVAHFKLGGQVDVPELIGDRFSPEGARPLASPVHMFRGEPRYGGGPATTPQPLRAAPSAPKAAGSARRQVTVAVLDTGIAAHPWFPAGSWAANEDVVDDEPDENNDYRLDAQAGHGTFVAGVVRQHAPDAALIVDRVLSSDGVCDELQLLRALRRLGRRVRDTGARVDVVNLSLGAYTLDDRPPAQVSRAIRDLGADAVVVAAAGNAGSDRPFWPAALDHVVGVGARSAEDGDSRAEFSNHGDWVDVWAEGEHVASSFLVFDGPLPKTANIDPDCFTGFATWSGTSFAAPRVAAEIARRSAEQDVPAARVQAEAVASFGFAPHDGGSRS